MENLDSDLLRTFLAVSKAGSVTDGANLINRSQSATSLQIKRLETILGQAVFMRHGRGIQLTEAGKRLLPVASDVTHRLDLTLQEFAGDHIQGKLRLAIPDDHGRTRLAQIIAEFSRTHPLVELEVTCALSTGFPGALNGGQLDMAVYEVEEAGSGEELVYEDPTCWVRATHTDLSGVDPLPVALFDHACWWRDAAITSLNQLNRPHRVVYSSQSVSGVLAAVEAGIAIGLVGRSSLHPGLSVLPPDFGLGLTPTSKLVLSASRSFRSPEISDAIRSAVRSAFGE
ncbi:MAG: LysR family transcriptional regulator [Roseibium sp.]|uniref:LysR family transcriptional regulator n=1 Tax=Roseibium sp. TaxID=1936156 RepID=UPI001AFD4330|nr:LysR family transcriptional regulator [Roseibium sp.]MBO6893387.1 LysR family transcriptional regulator [Roseibium sp.]MBO6932487.1 LysR family transcriptional regulator [Roseibium sp.]